MAVRKQRKGGQAWTGSLEPPTMVALSGRFGLTPSLVGTSCSAAMFQVVDRVSEAHEALFAIHKTLLSVEMELLREEGN